MQRFDDFLPTLADLRAKLRQSDRSASGSASPGALLQQKGAEWQGLADEWRASLSLEAELSARSAFATTEASPSAASNACGGRVDSDLGQGDAAATWEEKPEMFQAQEAASALPGSGPVRSQPFLRKGARMVRSQPPNQRRRRTSSTDGEPRLQPREAFRQAAVLTAGSLLPGSARKQGAPKPRRLVTTMRARSLAQEASASTAQPITPQRSRTRPHCIITPAAVSGPAQRGVPQVQRSESPPPGELEDKGTGSFSWKDPCASPRLDDDDEVVSQSEPARALEGSATLAGSAAVEVKEEIAAPRDLREEFEDVTQVSAEACAGGHLRLLDEQISQFRHDNEALARLRKQAVQAEAELALERETLRREVEQERRALRAEVEQERQALRRERQRLEHEAERKRRAVASERLELRERLDELREEMQTKERQWQRSVDRLQRQVDDLTRKNRELTELRSVSSSPVPRQSAGPSRKASRNRNGGVDRGESQRPRGAESVAESSASEVAAPQTGLEMMLAEVSEVGRLAEVPPLPVLAPPDPLESNVLVNGAVTAEPEAEAGPEAVDDASASPSARGRSAGRRARPVQLPGWSSAPAATEADDEADTDEDSSTAQPSLPSVDAALPGVLVREALGTDGRLQRFFDDGRCEVQFPSGMRKIIWPDGRTSVFFQNGDVKETHPDGVVVYRYQTTGAMQTTQPDGTEIYRFKGGQMEWHRPDGSKEIEFSNGARKRISAAGFEEVCPANSRGTWTCVDGAALEPWAAGAGA